MAPRGQQKRRKLPKYATVLSNGKGDKDKEMDVTTVPSPSSFQRFDSCVSELSLSTSHGSDEEEGSTVELTSLKPSNPTVDRRKVRQLVVGAIGIYASYVTYATIQEDLFRWRGVDPHNSGVSISFTFVWFLQAFESFITMSIGYFGRTKQRKQPLPMSPFFKSGCGQLAGKVLMSLSLAAGLSFPVVVLAKSAKIVPVMLGQLLMGGSTYTLRDYLFAFLIVSGTALVSAGSGSGSQQPPQESSFMGVLLICLSLTADGFTGGLQKKLKKETASQNPSAFDFLLYSHMAQFMISVVICCSNGELLRAPAVLARFPVLTYYVACSAVCSAVGQCFIFYVIACFDPLVCTTITTTRKMVSVMLSLQWKGHTLSGSGCLGLGLALSALCLEMEGKLASWKKRASVQR